MGDKKLARHSVNDRWLEDLKIKDKLKANCAPNAKKNELNRKTRDLWRSLFANIPRLRPYFVRVRRSSVHEEIVKRHDKPEVLSQTEPTVENPREFLPRFARTPTPSCSTPDLFSGLSRPSVIRRPISPPFNQGRTQSPKRTRTRSKSPINYRCSTSSLKSWGSREKLQSEIMTKIEKTKKARLYLLRQPGPHSFSVAGENTERVFKVSIGDQKCSCSDGNNHCIHLLFVMTRVLQVSENDPMMLSKELRRYEVDYLFNKYDKTLKRLAPRRKENQHPDSTTSNMSSNLSESVEEDDTCRICLNSMVDGEEFVSCQSGCRNKLHNHCMEIWTKECQRGNDAVTCPLCRRVWTDSELNQIKSSVQEAVVSSTVQASPSLPSPVPSIQCNVGNVTVSENHRDSTFKTPNKCSWFKDDVAIGCAEIFGATWTDRLRSHEWSVRENSLVVVIENAEKRMMEMINDETEFDVTKSIKWIKLTTCFADVLRTMVADPVYRIYSMSIRGVTSLLSYYYCVTKDDNRMLRTLVTPIVKAILVKCADGNSRTVKKSIATIVSLSCGQEGEMCVGLSADCRVVEDVCGLVFVLNCILDAEDHCLCVEMKCPNWQKILGRMVALDELMEAFPEEFHLLYIQSNKENTSLVTSYHRSPTTSLPYKLVNRKRLDNVLVFALKFLKHSHTGVRKMAERIFVRATRLTSHVPSVYAHACNMLSSVDPSLLERLRERTPDPRNDQRVMFTTVQLPNRRHSLGRSLPVRPNVPWFSPHSVSTPVNSRKSFPTAVRSVSSIRSSSLTPNLKCMKSRTPFVDLAPNLNSRPKRPNFLALNVNNRWSDVNAVSSARRCSRAGIGDECCFHYICHVHSSPCEQKCQSKRKRSQSYLPPVPPNTPQCPVGDLIDLSGDDRGAVRGRDVHDMRRMSLPLLSAMEAISETNSANLLALKFQKLSSKLAVSRPFSSSFCSPLSSIGTACGNDVDDVNMSIDTNSSYKENIHWVRCELLGSGGFSSCYLGRDINSGTYMAVKQVSFKCADPNEQYKHRAQIHREISIMMKLDHPNVVRLLTASLQEDHYDLFVEWMPGGSVAAALKKFGRFSDHVITHYVSQVLAGLGYLHDLKIIHRDIKGANLLIDSTGHHLRIGDFGVAKRLVTHTTLPGEFRNEILGTVAFMAPEVLRSEEYGRSCDVWSVGCCVIEMVTAQPPWNVAVFTNETALYYRIASKLSPPPIPEEMSPEMQDFALCCLQLDRDMRPTVKQLQAHHLFRDL